MMEGSTQTLDADAIKMRVEGMDCAACAIKIENALKRLPGVSDVNVSYASETLTLRLDSDRTARSVLEGRIRALGYSPMPLDAGEPGAVTAPRVQSPTSLWWKTPKATTVLATALLLASAGAVSVAVPALGQWSFALAALVGLVPVVRRAAAAFLGGTPFTIETLMSIATVGAIAIGSSEEAAVVIFLFAVGELLERIAAARARAGIESLIGLMPRTARVERDGAIEEVPIDALRVDDTVMVRPGDRVPSDGEVIEGRSEVDEAPVTGESVPIAKGIGDTVYAASINANGVLRVRITRTAADNTIARIVRLVEQAQASKAPTARFIDRFAAWYTPAAMAVALAIVVAPPLLAGAEWSTWIYRGLASLLIACPCALVISTPAAIASGLAAGARRGLLIKGGAALETLGRVRTVAFDKTGTLTLGRPLLTDIVALEGSEDDVLSKAAAVERDSSHPIGIAIVAAAGQRGLAVPKTFGGATAVPGKAVTARLRDGFVSVGSPRHAAELGSLADAVHARITAFEAEGKTVVVVLSGKRAVGVIALRDEPRPDAAAAVARLKDLHVRPLMLTGDGRLAAESIARRLSVEVQPELLPDAKLDAIAALKAAGPTAMIGDGINDAPALACANVGVAMGSGTEVALEVADAALLTNRVAGVVEMVTLSRATLANIRQNIAIALGLKVVFLATTLTGATSLWMAILADTGGTVLVTANALRLLGFGRWARGGHGSHDTAVD